MSGTVNCNFLSSVNTFVTPTPAPTSTIVYTPVPTSSLAGGTLPTTTQSVTPAPSVSPIPTSVPSQIAGQGAVTYDIAQIAHSPQFYQATVDPLDVHPGQTQTMDVQVMEATSTNDPTGTSPIVSVVAAVTTDTGVKNYNLTLSSGTNLDGGWSGSWVVQDTHSDKYSTTFTAKNALGESSSVTLNWVDPCTPATGGSWTIDSNCSFSSVNGVDNGNVILNNPTYNLTVNANSTFVWNPGKALQLTQGAIILADTSSLVQSYLWMQDADSDGYPAATTQVASYNSPGANYDRRYQEVTTTSTDCADSDNTKWQNINGYLDTDGDSYTVGSITPICTGSSLTWSAGTPYRTVAKGPDCNDANAGPCTPSSLTVSNVSSSQLNISWVAPSSSTGPAATGYSLYYCIGASCTSMGLLVSNQAGTTYSHTPLAASTTYGYQVTAYSNVTGGNSNVTSIQYGTTGAACSNGYQDVDKDGYGAGSYGCYPPSGSYNVVANNTDCNDSYASVYVSASCYHDGDHDGYGAGSTYTCMNNATCTSATAGSIGTGAPITGTYFSANNTDCNDGNGSVWVTQTLYADADGDGYTSGGGVGVCTNGTVPAGYRAAPNGSDCNDSDASRWQYLTCAHDGDGDGWGDTLPGSYCSGATCPAGYSANSGDCCDSDSGTYPGNPNYYTTKDACGSYDHDCSGGATCYCNGDSRYPYVVSTTWAPATGGYYSGRSCSGLLGTCSYIYDNGYWTAASTSNVGGSYHCGGATDYYCAGACTTYCRCLPNTNTYSVKCH
jgi:hypothetical protein